MDNNYIKLANRNHIGRSIERRVVTVLAVFLVASQCFSVETAEEWKVIEEKNKFNNVVITLQTGSLSVKGIQSEVRQQNGETRIAEIWSINDLTIVMSRTQESKQASISMAGVSPNLYFTALSKSLIGNYQGDFILIRKNSSEPLICLRRAPEDKYYSIMSSTEDRNVISLYEKKNADVINSLLNK